MTKIINKNDEWYRSIHLKSFRSTKAVMKYMDETAEQNWRQVDLKTLPDKAAKVFGKTKEEFYDFYKFYQNDLRQHIRIHCDYDGDLWNIDLLKFIDKMNVGDSEKTPILVNFFKNYVDNPDGIHQLFKVACEALGFDELVKKEDIKKLNKWVVHQMETMMTPIYYQEKYYAYLIIIIGELLLKNKLKGWFWKVEYTKIHLINEDDEDIEIKYIYNPFLCNSDGVKIDILQACRVYLFYEVGNVRNVFTNVYNNIEKYDVKKQYPLDYSYSP